MSNFNFKLPDGQSFEIKMPSGATFEQAQAIFKQQVDSGGLVGFRVGDAVNAATQAADGLAAAAAAAQQGVAGALNGLPSGANLGSISASVGPLGAGAANQLKSAATGALPSIASLTTGASATINGAISGATSGITAGLGALQSGLPAVVGALTGQASQVGSVANNAIKTISNNLTGTPLSGINVADFAKQGPSLGAIGSLTAPMVTGTLAQASKLIGQPASDLTNSLGLGKFGLDAKQLETAGFLKPGTAAAFLETGEADLTSVLKSPLPWTGKDGVTSVTGLLNNSQLQDKIQQGLMTTGLDAVKQLGVPTDKLAPTALSGVATLAAKDPAGAVAALTGGADLPAVPNLGSLADKVKDVMSNSAFAVKFTEGKVEPPLKQEESPPAETNTVDTATVDAAGERIVGNNKVPSVLASSGLNDATTKTAIYVAFIGSIYAEGLSIESKILNLNAGLSITQEAWNTVNQEFIAIKSTYNSRIEDVEKTAVTAINALGAPQNTDLVQKFTSAQELISKSLFPLFDLIKQKLRDLANKIST